MPSAFAFACLALLAPQAPDTPSVAPAQRIEAFVLEQVDPLAAADLWTLLGTPPSTPYGEAATPPQEQGFLLWKCSADGAARTLEWDLLFGESQTRLLEVERRDGSGESLVYREMQPRSGRTLRADWLDEGATLRLREWGGRDGRQARLEGAAGGRFRLGLLEDLRTDAQPASAASVFDPLARRFEHLAVAVEVGASDGPWAGARLVRLTREDGSSAGACLVRDGGVVGFQWQAGGLRARRNELDEYRLRLEQLEAQRAAEAKAKAGSQAAAAAPKSG
jgi:hypothetical protein